jgi:hypothetical protein
MALLMTIDDVETAAAGYELELRLLRDDLAGFGGGLEVDERIRAEISRRSWEESGHPPTMTLRLDSSGILAGAGWIVMSLETYNGIVAQFRGRGSAFPVVTIPAGLWRELRCPHVLAAQLATPLPDREPADAG